FRRGRWPDGAASPPRGPGCGSSPVTIFSCTPPRPTSWGRSRMPSASGPVPVVPPAWTAGPVIDRGTVTVAGLIEAQASATPDAPAVRTADAALTYRELDERSSRIAHHLLACGVRAETLVGVCLGRTIDLVPALLGVWKAGGAYLPLDPALPPRRLAHMMAA